MIAPRLLAIALAVLLPGMLIGCHPPPPPPPPAEPPPPPSPAPPPAPASISTRWSFAVGETGCLAHASGHDMSLALSVDAQRKIEMTVAGSAVRKTVRRGGVRGRLRFEGAGGRWTLPARTSPHHAVLASVRLDEATAGDVLKLLGGGRLHTEVRGARVPVLRLPDSDVAGREWFGCVRKELGGSAPAG